MYEKRLEAVPPVAFIANGTSLGQITLLSTAGFKVKQVVILKSTTVGPANFEVKRVDSENILFVGPIKTNIGERSDISAYLVVDGSTISAAEQVRPTIPEQEIERLTYEEEPTVARRVVLVDQFGDKFDSVTGIDGLKRLAVDADVTIEGGVTVDLDAFTNPPDNVLIVGSEDGTKLGVKHAVRVDSELDVRVGISDGANKATVNVGGELSVTDVALDVNLSTRASEVTVASINSKLNTLGQKPMAGSVPVVIASDQDIDVTIVNSIIRVEYDQITVASKNIEGDPLVIEYRLASSLVATATITYDSDGDFQDMVVA